MKANPSELLRFKGMLEEQLIGQESPEYAAKIVNMEHDPQGFWRRSFGTVPISPMNFGAGTGAIWEATVWRPTRGIARIVTEQSAIGAQESTLQWVNLADQANETITTRRRGAGQWRVQPWLHFGRWLYHFNGLEQPIRWDGTRVAPVGFPAPPAPPRVSDATQDGNGLRDSAAAALDTVTGMDYNHRLNQRGVGEFVSSGTATWRYAYGVTVINDIGQESPMSALCWAHGENDTTYGRRILRLHMSRQADRIRAVRLWRSQNLEGVTGNGTPSMYEVAAFEFAGDFDYLDHASDLDLGEAYDPERSGPIPFGAHSPALYQGMLFLLTDDAVVYSYPGFIEQFPSQNFLPIATATYGRPTATHVVSKGVLVFCERAVLMVKGGAATTPWLEVVSGQVGTSAPASIVSVPGHGTFFLSSDHGPQLLKGTLEDAEPTAVVTVSGIGQTWARDYQGTPIVTAAGVYRPDVREVWWSIPRLGGFLPRDGLVLHLAAGGWSTRTNYTWTVAISLPGVGPGGLILGGWDDSVDGVETPGAATGGLFGGGGGGIMGTDGVAGVYETGVVSGARPRLLQAIGIGVIANGQVDVAVDLKVDRSTTWASVSDTARQAVHGADPEPEVGGELDQPDRAVREVWQEVGAATGSSLWSTDRVWFDLEPAQVIVSCRPEMAHDHQLRFTTTDGQLYGVNLMFAPSGGQSQPRQEKP